MAHKDHAFCLSMFLNVWSAKKMNTTKWVELHAEVWEFFVSVEFLIFGNFLMPKFQFFLLFSAYFWHFCSNSHCFFFLIFHVWSHASVHGWCHHKRCYRSSGTSSISVAVINGIATQGHKNAHVDTWSGLYPRGWWVWRTTPNLPKGPLKPQNRPKMCCFVLFFVGGLIRGVRFK